MTALRHIRLLTPALVLALGACTGNVAGVYPRVGTVVPSATVQLTENATLSLSQIATAGVVAATAYILLDPSAPNWHIEETRYGNGQYHLAMQQKNYTGGGGGEARQFFQRRGAELARQNGYAGYQIVSFTEGIEFAYPVSRRVSQGVIQLVAGSGN